jgi:hypothetical protein
MWKLLMFWCRAPSPYVPLEEASRELSKVWPLMDQCHRLEPERVQVEDKSCPRISDHPKDMREWLDLNPPPVQNQVRTAERHDIPSLMRELLLRRVLTGYVESDSGSVRQLPQEFWSDGVTAELAETQRYNDKRFEYRLSGKVVVSREQLSTLMDVAAHLQKQDTKNRARDRGGAPPKYDSEAFLMEAFRIVYEGKPTPKTEADLRRRALDAYVEAGLPGGTPSEDWAREKIQKLWRRVRLGR